MSATPDEPPAQRWRESNPHTFYATVLAAAEQLDVQALAVEKDYWVCEALRAMTMAYPDNIVFKGGTSLEKLRIIQRFSEDLDVLVTGDIGGVNPAKRVMRAMVSAAAKAVNKDAAVDGETSGGSLGSLHRSAYLQPELRNDSTAGIADAKAILVELGQSGGPQPSSVHQVESLLSRALAGTDGFVVGEWSDLAPFDVTILHPGRTLLEKLLRLNNFAVRHDDGDAHGWSRVGRQFYDVWALLGEDAVLELLAERDNVRDILESAAAVSEAFGGDEPLPVEGFASCAVFSVDGPLRARLEAEHATAMSSLYYGNPAAAPSFEYVLIRVREHADSLRIA